MRIQSSIFVFIYILSLLSANTVIAAEQAATEPAATKAPAGEEKRWQGEAALGILTTRGNTETESINGKLAIEYKKQDWHHLFKLDALRSKDKSVVTADRTSLAFRSQYDLAKREFIFGSIRYEDDAFAGFEQRTTETLGYGYRLFDLPDLTTDIEAGVGARQTELTDGSKVNEGIVRLATNIVWKISATSTLKESLSVEAGEENTLLESITNLKVKINSALALQVSVTVKDNSDVPVDKKHTDTETSVALVYDF